MTPFEVAEMLESFARQVTELPGVSRTNPHAFAEAKSELAGAMMREATRLRTVRRPGIEAGAIRPGVRQIGGRQVQVQVRIERRRA